MRRGPEQALSRRRALAGIGVAVALLTGLIALTEGLRRPVSEIPTGGGLDELDRDPRVALECPEPEPREDLERGGPTISPAGPPVDVSADELLNCPDAYDRRTVRYRGEVIGGLMHRGDGAWAQMNDDPYAGDSGPLPAHQEYRGSNVGVGVFLPDGFVDQISTVGGPRTRGDLVEVVGVFRRVDRSTREVVVIRASSAQVVRTGEAFADPPLRSRQVAAGLLALLAAAMVGIERTVSRRRSL